MAHLAPVVWRSWLIGLVMLGATACAPPPEAAALPTTLPPVAMVTPKTSPTATFMPPSSATLAAPTNTPPGVTRTIPSATPTGAPTALPTIIPPASEFGRTAEGVYVRGAADAPVTVIDYSDFL